MTLIDVPHTPIHCMNLVRAGWHSPPGARHLTIHSPYTGDIIGDVPMSGPDEVNDAIAQATSAFPKWSDTPIKERAQIVFKFRQNVVNNLDKIANTAALESGKTLAEARAEVLKGLEVVEFALSLQNMAHGDTLEVSRGVWCRSSREPLGVVVGIAPFNFPAMVPMWMYPIAIMLGNCFVLKPSEKVPLTSQLMGDCWLDAGLPPGVFSVVNGDRTTVEALATHPFVQAVGFVGSTDAARTVYAMATSAGKRALCLGGAKNCMLLAPDADEQLATAGVVASFSGCAGQRCMAGSLLLAIGDTESLIQRIVAAASEIVPGESLGAIIDAASLERISGLIAEAVTQGASLALDGRASRAPRGYEGGNWLGPTILDNVTLDMHCAHTEIFGPVLSIIRVNSISEALEIESRLEYGNATSIFTTSGAIADLVARRCSAGMVGINVGVPVPREPFSFGGTKNSKFGPCDITGMSAVELWSSLKKVTSRFDRPHSGSSPASAQRLAGAVPDTSLGELKQGAKDPSDWMS